MGRAMGAFQHSGLKKQEYSMKIRSWLILFCFLIPSMAQDASLPNTTQNLISAPRGAGLQTLAQWKSRPQKEGDTSRQAIVILRNLEPKTRAATLKSVAWNLGGTLLDTVSIGGRNTYALVRLEGTHGEARSALAKMKAPGWTLHENNAHHPFSDDPMFGNQWALYNDGSFSEGENQAIAGADIDMIPAWEITRGSSDVVVAVIDSGIDYNHPDLAANMWRNPGEIPGNGLDDDGNGFVDDVVGYDFGGATYESGPDSDPMDKVGHGTHVAGIIGAVGDNGIGISGVSPNVRLMAVKNFSDYGSASDFNSIKAIAYATANGAAVINASWGGSSFNEALKQAIADAGQLGVLFVAAAGNDSLNIDFDMPLQVGYPAGYSLPNLLAVASTDEADETSYFSNSGMERVHLAAPGSSILSTVPAREIFFAMNATKVKNTHGSLELMGNLTLDNSIRSGKNQVHIRGQQGFVTFPKLNLLDTHGAVLSMSYNGKMGKGGQASLEFFNGRDWKPIAQAHSSHGKMAGQYKIAIPAEMLGLHFRFRLKLQSPGSVMDFGLSNVTVSRVLAPGDPNANYEYAYEINSGTSMAAPHVAGVAALLLAQDPSLSVDGLVSKLLAGAEELSILGGEVLSGARLNAYSALTVGGQSKIFTNFQDRSLAQGEYAPFTWILQDNQQAQSTTLYQGVTPVPGTELPVSHQNGYIHWFTPNVPAGDGYRIKLDTTSGPLFSGSFSIRKAQPANFPDPVLRETLTAWFDKNQDSRLTLSELDRFKDYLFLENLDVVSMEGLDQFSKIYGLYIYNMANLLQLGELPSDLLSLYVGVTGLRTIGEFPPYLQEMAIWCAPLTQIGDLPEHLLSVAVASTHLEALPNIPNELFFLDLSYNRLKALPETEAYLFSLNLSGNFLSLDGLDLDSLYELYLNDMGLESLPDLTPAFDLSTFECRNNRLRSLPPLPEGIWQMDVSNNRLETLAMSALPSSLNIRNNRLQSLPGLEGVNFLDCSENQLEALPALPEYLFSLVCDNNLIESIPTIPPYMQTLQIRNNLLTQLPEIPESLLNLIVSGNQLRSLPVLSKNHVVQELDVSNNLLTEMPDLSVLTNLHFIHLSNNFLTQTPFIPENYLFVAHLDGNYFSGDDCDEIQRLYDLDLKGFTFRLFGRTIGPEIDGLAINPQGDGTIVDCETLIESASVESLALVKLAPRRYQVSWQGGRIANREIEGYRVEVFHNKGLLESATTSATHVIFNELKDRKIYNVRVTPFHGDVDGPSAELNLRAVEWEDLERDEERHSKNRRTYRVPNIGADTQRWAGFAAVNGGDRAISLKMRAFDASGELLKKVNLAPSLKPGSRLDIQPQSIFGNMMNRIAWFELKTTGPCSFLALGGESHSAFCIPVSDQVFSMGTVHMGHRHSPLQPELHIINPNGEAAEVSFNIYNYNSELMDTFTKQIPARGAATISYHQLAPPNSSGLVTWTSNQPLAVTEISQSQLMPEYQFTMQQSGMGASSGVLPFFGEFIQIHNTNAFEVSVNFEAYGSSGQLDIARTVTVPPMGSIIMDAIHVLFSVNTEKAKGSHLSLRYHAEAPVKVSLEIQPGEWGTNPIMGNYMGDMVPAASHFGNRFIIPHFASDNRWNSQVVVVNASHAASQVTLTAYNKMGRKLGHVERDLAALGRTVFDAKTLLDDSQLSSRKDVAWVKITGSDLLSVHAVYLGEDVSAPSMAAQQILPQDL